MWYPTRFPRYPGRGHSEKACEELRRLTKISCWHRADYESDAMWKLYAKDGKGVAVQTTIGRLQASLLPFRLAPEYGEEEPWWGTIRYVDLHKERLRVSMEQLLFHKHRAYEWEREFRVAISVRMAEEFAIRVPEYGIEVPFGPEKLVESIYIGPGLESPDINKVMEACEAMGLSGTLKTSTLRGKPRYT